MKTSDNQKVPLGGFRGVTKKIDFFNTPDGVAKELPE
jgi:hypothetical protein